MKINIKYKLIGFSILIIIFSTFFSSCYDKSELNEIGLVIGMGIDKVPNDNSILLTIELTNPNNTKGPSEDSGGGTNSILQVSTGKTLYDAIQNLSKATSVKIDFTHTKVIIMSKELCESGISKELDFFGRNRQFRDTNWILISNRTAQEALKSKISNENITSSGLDKMMNKLKKNAFILPVNYNNFIIGLESQSKSSFAPVIDIEKSNGASQGKIKIEKLSVFKNDRLIGILSTEESKNLAWFSNKIKGDTVVFPLKSVEKNKNISVEIFENSTKITPHIDKDGVHFEILCKGNATIRELENITINPEMIEKIEKDTETILKSQLSELIDKSQKDLNADFMGFSENIYNIDPTTWSRLKKNWDKLYPNIKYEINVQIKLNKMGMIKNAPITKEEEEELK